ncbi:hypothetical protein CHS0354_024561 [Potamilus streckersoni]|uniref:Uncharacterized protein n=1 Tax=Potamilus streckersoni TaxID=2493646 RepID=A0AAE0WHJ9_9BIVA|nr:hypothetical protein CHS0354_024561 [Potamilus streckersoni]
MTLTLRPHAWNTHPKIPLQEGHRDPRLPQANLFDTKAQHILSRKIRLQTPGSNVTFDTWVGITHKKS